MEYKSKVFAAKTGAGSKSLRESYCISPNAIAAHIFKSSRAPRDKAHSSKIKKELTDLKRISSKNSPYFQPFLVAEISAALMNKDWKGPRP